MEKQLFPKEFIRPTLEHYTFIIRRKSSAIYLVILLSIGLMLALLPFISLDVTVSSMGLIGTNEQRHVLSSAVGGRITWITEFLRMVVSFGRFHYFSAIY